MHVLALLYSYIKLIQLPKRLYSALFILSTLCELFQSFSQAFLLSLILSLFLTFACNMSPAYVFESNDCAVLRKNGDSEQDKWKNLSKRINWTVNCKFSDRTLVIHSTRVNKSVKVLVTLVSFECRNDCNITIQFIHTVKLFSRLRYSYHCLHLTLENTFTLDIKCFNSFRFFFLFIREMTQAIKQLLLHLTCCVLL